jgi:hypothetical protein
VRVTCMQPCPPCTSVYTLCASCYVCKLNGCADLRLVPARHNEKKALVFESELCKPSTSVLISGSSTGVVMPIRNRSLGAPSRPPMALFCVEAARTGRVQRALAPAASQKSDRSGSTVSDVGNMAWLF